MKIKTLAENIFKQIKFRIVKPTSIKESLFLVCDPDIVESLAAKCSDLVIIEHASKVTKIPQETLLSHASNTLGVDFVTTVATPNINIIKRTKHDINKLKNRLIVPIIEHNSLHGYALVTSSPTSLNINAFKEKGVNTYLALPSVINDAWKRFDDVQNQIGEDKLFSILKRLALDAINLGAEEVMIGYPNQKQYQFTVNKEIYRGTIHPGVIPSLEKYLQFSNKIKKSVDLETIDSLSISLTKKDEEKSIVLSWTQRQTQIVDDKPAQYKNVIDFRQSKANINSQIENKPLNSGQLNQTEGKSVYLVDDDERFLFILRRILENNGWEVQQFSSAEFVLNKLSMHSNHPDLVISDVHMPQTDGVKFAKSLKNLIPQLPILMLSSDEDPFIEVELANLGVNAFVNKQQDPKILLAWANNLISKASKEARAQMQA